MHACGCLKKYCHIRLFIAFSLQKCYLFLQINGDTMSTADPNVAIHVPHETNSDYDSRNRRSMTSTLISGVEMNDIIYNN